jgi:hypothetical protein
VKITRKKLRSLIKEAITDMSKGALGQIPYRDPGQELKSDMTPDQIEKFDTRIRDAAQKDQLASALGHESESYTDEQYEFKLKMTAQDPESEVYNFMKQWFEDNLDDLEYRSEYSRGQILYGLEVAYDELEAIKNQEANPTPLETLDSLFKSIADLNSQREKEKDRYSFVILGLAIRFLRRLMQNLAEAALERDYIADEFRAQKYLGDEGRELYDPDAKQRRFEADFES